MKSSQIVACKSLVAYLCGRVNWYRVGESSSVRASLLWASLHVGELTGYRFENNANAWKINKFFIIKQIKKPRLCSVLLWST